ncbi:MAG: hypothetical protein P1Q69_13075 [Candidatus Thorarchaeota archaeon]|nr:hypothetical protein [Candidatus Thorarchaeota archaeon]
MSPCKLDQKRRSDAVDEFKTVLSAYGIAIAQPKDSLGVSNIGVPDARQTLRKLRDKGASKLLLARGTIIFVVIVLFILSLISETNGVPTLDVLRPFVIASGQAIFEAVYTIYIGYIFVPMAMVIISIVFLYHDYYLLASSERARTIFPWDWFGISLIVVLLGGFIFGFVLETILLQINSISLDALGVDAIIVYGFGLIVIAIPFSLKVFTARYVHWRNSVHYEINLKVKAVRECILSSSPDSIIDASNVASEEIIGEANKSLARGIIMRALFGALILSILLSVIWVQIGQFIIIDLAIQLISGTLSFGISFIAFWLSRKSILSERTDLENTIGSLLIVTYFLAIPFSYISSGILLSISLIGFGFLASMFLLYQGRILSLEHSSLLGYCHYKSLLHLSNKDSSWDFIKSTLTELDEFMKRNYLILDNNRPS